MVRTSSMNSKRRSSASPVNRREFLRSAALLTGMTATDWALPVGRSNETQPSKLHERGLPGSSILDLPASSAPVDHIVVLMMENRSFDHYLGWLGSDQAYVERGRSRYGSDFSVDGSNSLTYKDPQGREIATYYLPDRGGEMNPYRGCGHADPGHAWDQGRTQRDRGFIAQGSGNDEFALGYYASNDLPFYSLLARRFTVFDHYHASLLGPTFPNRAYLHSAQSGGVKDNFTALLGFPWQTIWDRLGKAQVPAAYYYVDLPVLALWGFRLIPFCRPIGDYFNDAASGKLPNVVFIDPRFIGDMHNDDHPFADVRAGQKFVFDLIDAFVRSLHWRSGMFIVTYDEWGGFFDHVAPPVFPDDRQSANDLENFGQAGFRVPTMMVSPYARSGFVDHRPYEHTSILRFIEWRFLGAPPEGPGSTGDTWFLTKRDRYANNIGASLTPDEFNPDTDLGPPAQTISRSCSGVTEEGAPAPSSLPDRDDSSGEKNPFVQAYESGYFQAVGYKVYPQTRVHPKP